MHQSRWHLCQLATTVAALLVAAGLATVGHPAPAVAAAMLAIGQVGWFAAAAANREHWLRTQLALANIDAVTGLPNRRPLYRHLATLPASDAVTVAYLDCDGLKTINDAYGHQVGDGLLAEVAARLRASCVPGDVLVHLSGDEFALATTRDQHALTDHLVDIGRDATVGDFVLPVRASIGTCRTHGGDPELALGAAEAAMYTAKRNGGGIAHYRPGRDGPPRLIQPRRHHADAFGDRPLPPP